MALFAVSALLAVPFVSTEVVSTTETSPIEAPILDLAFLDAERFLVLHPDAVAVHRWDGSSLHLEVRQELSGPFSPVRAAAGILVVSHRDQAVWVLTNRSPRAHLFAIESQRLVHRQEADAVPWPGSPTGLRFRTGTDWLEGQIQGLGEGPFLRVVSGESPLAVRPDGTVAQPLSDVPAKIGSAAACLWPGVLAVSSPHPPSSRDELLLLAQDDFRVTGMLPVEGTIRALAAHVQADTARVLVGLQDSERRSRLAIVDLKRRVP